MRADDLVVERRAAGEGGTEGAIVEHAVAHASRNRPGFFLERFEGLCPEPPREHRFTLGTLLFTESRMRA
jgi:hypothetical protein